MKNRILAQAFATSYLEPGRYPEMHKSLATYFEAISNTKRARYQWQMLETNSEQ